MPADRPHRETKVLHNVVPDLVVEEAVVILPMEHPLDADRQDIFLMSMDRIPGEDDEMSGHPLDASFLNLRHRRDERRRVQLDVGHGASSSQGGQQCGVRRMGEARL
jgi:hypothetical protein